MTIVSEQRRSALGTEMRRAGTRAPRGSRPGSDVHVLCTTRAEAGRGPAADVSAPSVCVYGIVSTPLALHLAGVTPGPQPDFTGETRHRALRTIFVSTPPV